MRDILRALFPPKVRRGTVLEIDYSTVTESICPACRGDRCVTFDVLTLDDTGVTVLTNLKRCFSCSPLDPPKR